MARPLIRRLGPLFGCSPQAMKSAVTGTMSSILDCVTCSLSKFCAQPPRGRNRSILIPCFCACQAELGAIFEITDPQLGIRGTTPLLQLGQFFSRDLGCKRKVIAFELHQRLTLSAQNEAKKLGHLRIERSAGRTVDTEPDRTREWISAVGDILRRWPDER